jgi:hypothetical protein
MNTSPPGVTLVTSPRGYAAYVDTRIEMDPKREVLYMKRNLMALSGMLACALACGDGRNNDQSAGGAGTGAESGALPADTGTAGAGVDDTTAAPSTNLGTPSRDTTADTGSATVGDEANQDQSGVTNTETGESELGGGVKKTRPDQGAPVTSKGDTVGRSTSGSGAGGGDSTQ